MGNGYGGLFGIHFIGIDQIGNDEVLAFMVADEFHFEEFRLIGTEEAVDHVVLPALSFPVMAGGIFGIELLVTEEAVHRKTLMLSRRLRNLAASSWE